MQYRGLGGCRVAAAECGDARRQLRHGKGFYEIIIPASAQAGKPVVQPAEGGEEQSRRVDAGAAQGLQQGKSVQEGQHAVDDQDLERLHCRSQQASAAVRRDGDLVPFRRQALAEMGGGFGVVLDQQNFHVPALSIP